MEYSIRKTNLNDLSPVLSIYQKARQFMKNNNNPDQWGDDWPSEERIRQDINEGISYVVCSENKIYAVFAFIIGIDNTYLDIREGKWLSNKEYGTIHRLASSFETKGIFPFIQTELEKNHQINFRIDTHKNNQPMRRQILKTGYKYCGIITPIEGGERLAYEKVII